MAISSGWGPHFAWLETDGGTFLIQEGTCDLNATRKTGTFTADIPMSEGGALSGLATATQGSIIVQTRGQTATLISGELTNIEVDFIGTIIKVSGADQSMALHQNKTSEKWVNQLGSNIVEQLASRVGLSVQADSSLVMAGKMVNIDYARVTDGISYAGAIHKLAELDGARWFVQGNTLYYQSTSSPQGSYTLNYSYGPPIVSDCLQLRVIRNVQASKNINVSVKSWHPRQKQVFTGQQTVGGIGGSLSYVFHIPNLLQDHAQQYANTKAAEIARNGLTVEAECVGDPGINITMSLQLNGTDYFDGTYQIDNIHHEFGMRGHTMSITGKSAANSSGGPAGDTSGSESGDE